VHEIVYVIANELTAGLPPPSELTYVSIVCKILYIMLDPNAVNEKLRATVFGLPLTVVQTLPV